MAPSSRSALSSLPSCQPWLVCFVCFYDFQLFLTSSGNPSRSTVLCLCSSLPLCLPQWWNLAHCTVVLVLFSPWYKHVLKVRDTVLFGSSDHQVLVKHRDKWSVNDWVSHLKFEFYLFHQLAVWTSHCSLNLNFSISTMRDLARIICEISGLILFFLPLWLSDCRTYIHIYTHTHTHTHTHTWRLLTVVRLSNFKVSELSLLKFTTFIMTCPTSVHQLKRSEAHPVVWHKITELIIYPRLPSCNLFPLIYTEVVCVLFFFPSAMSLQRHRFLFYFVTLSWAVLIHCPYLKFRMFFSSRPTPVPFPFLFVQDGD